MTKGIEIKKVLKKEVFTEARGLKLPITILVFNIALAIISVMMFHKAFEVESTGYASSYANMIDSYGTMLIIEYIVILFIIPLYSATAISREYEKGTMDLLLMTKTSMMEIISGKLIAVISTVMLLVISSMPVLGVIFLAGGITLVDFIEFFVLVGTTTLFIGTIGFAMSTFIKKTIPAVFTTYGILLFLTVGTYLIVSIAYSVADNNNNADYYKGVEGVMYKDTDLGLMPAILMLNPVFSIIKLVNNQISSSSNFRNAIAGLGNSNFIIDHWLTLSVLLQFVLVGIITYACFLVSKMRHSKEN